MGLDQKAFSIIKHQICPISTSAVTLNFWKKYNSTCQWNSFEKFGNQYVNGFTRYQTKK